MTSFLQAEIAESAPRPPYSHKPIPQVLPSYGVNSPQLSGDARQLTTRSARLSDKTSVASQRWQHFWAEKSPYRLWCPPV